MKKEQQDDDENRIEWPQDVYVQLINELNDAGLLSGEPLEAIPAFMRKSGCRDAEVPYITHDAAEGAVEPIWVINVETRQRQPWSIASQYCFTKESEEEDARRREERARRQREGGG